jgi:hypothetical protein
MKNHNPSRKYSFLFETARVVHSNDIKILTESDAGDGKRKIAANVLLQEADVRNQNQRKYSSAICESITNQLRPKASSRSLMMEIDHPMFVAGSDPNILKKRAAIVEIGNCGALIRDISFNGKKINGIFESLSGFRGPDLYNLIVKDKVDLGVSLRALGSVEPLQDGTLIVQDPIRAITYDWVSSPSHQNARVLDFLPECYTDFMPMDTMYESADLSKLNDDHIMITENAGLIKRFLDDILQERFDEVISKGVKFRI